MEWDSQKIKSEVSTEIQNILDSRSHKKISEDKRIEIENYIIKEIENQHFPGSAAAFVHENRILYQKGVGAAGLSGREVTIHTPFGVIEILFDRKSEEYNPCSNIKGEMKFHFISILKSCQ